MEAIVAEAVVMVDHEDMEGTTIAIQIIVAS